MATKKKPEDRREYSREFTPLRGKGKTYTIKKIPMWLWDAISEKAAKERKSVRAQTLRLLQAWVQGEFDGREIVASGGDR